MSDIPFDLESELQGTDPEIEIKCFVLIPPIRKNTKPMECLAVFKRADSDERSEILKTIREKETFQLSLERDMAKYQGFISRLSAGDEVAEADEGVDLEILMENIHSNTEEYVNWFKSIIRDRLIRIKKFTLKNGKKVTIEEDQMEKALDALFKWDHYTQGLSQALKDSLSVEGVEQARIKN